MGIIQDKIMQQMQQIGQPNVAKSVSTITQPDEQLDLGSLGMMIMLMLGMGGGGTESSLGTTPIPGARNLGGVAGQAPANMLQRLFGQ